MTGGEGMIDPALIREARERADLVALVSEVTQLRKDGRRWVGCCPFHEERTPSFSVYPDDNSYHCYGCSAHGDAISWVRWRESITFRAAVERLAGGAAVASLPPVEKRAKVDGRREWQPMLPVPEHAPPFHGHCKRFGKPVATWWYHNADGARLMVDARYEWQEEDRTKKAVITWCWARDTEGTEQWAQTRPSEGLPLYGLELLAARPDDAVLICEGCKATEAARRYLPSLVAMTWCGGVGSAQRADVVAWQPLAGRKVWLWPDADWVGLNAAGWITDHLQAIGAEVLGVLDVRGRPEGWDAADGEEADAKATWVRRSETIEKTLSELAEIYPRPVDKQGKPTGTPCRILGGKSAPAPAAKPVAERKESEGPTREAWLLKAIAALAPLLAEAQAPALPEGITVQARRIKGMSESILGTCTYQFGRSPRINVWPDLDNPGDLLPVLLHELVHAAVGPQHQHGGLFATVANALGFGKPLSRYVPPQKHLLERLATIAEGLGAYPPPPPPPTIDHHAGESEDPDERGDIANASRFVADHQEGLIYLADVERWHVWDGRRWAPDMNGGVWLKAEATMRKLAKELIEQATALRRASASADDGEAERMKRQAGRFEARADQVQSRKKMADMLELARCRPELSRQLADCDRDEHLLCVLNGVVDLNNGQVRKHDRALLMTRMAPVEYDAAAAELPLLQKVLANVCNFDEAVVAYAQEILGRSMFGNNDLQQIYVWSGEGGSGKGTLFEAVKAALGDYCLTAEFQSFVKTQGYRVRDDLDRLKEARVVLASEAEKGEQLAAAVLKSISGGDTIAARALYGSYKEFRARMTLHLQVNDKPRVDDRDSGMWRRLVLIPCGPQVPAEKRDPKVARTLLDPATGGKAILAWLVAGAVRSHGKPRIELPAAVKAATADYRQEQDPTKEAFQEILRFAPPDKVQQTFACVRDVVGSFHAWCDEMKIPAKVRISDRALADRLEARGCYRKKARIVQGGKPESLWFGVTLAHDKDHTAAGSTYVPNDKEHYAALGCSCVPEFLASGKVPHAHAKASESGSETTRGDFVKSQEHRNRGTEEERKEEVPAPEPVIDGPF